MTQKEALKAVEVIAKHFYAFDRCNHMTPDVPWSKYPDRSGYRHTARQALIELGWLKPKTGELHHPFTDDPAGKFSGGFYGRTGFH